MDLYNTEENQLKGNRHGETIDVDALWMTDPKAYKEAQEHFNEAIGDLKATKVPQMVITENPTGLNMFYKDNKKGSHL